ncbi:REP-associated tyrosine transposase [Motilimonas sp. KMU-193]|uniref:REP-associated tyrosine transposase n=1 Tax=Motilimonas sp. KMU-193 TaxID=3388668 RepID=UPI00396B2B3D
MVRYHANDLRKGRISLVDHLYMVTANTYQRQTIFSRFFSARILIRCMGKAELEGRCLTHAFVVMPDHFHWLVTLTSQQTLSDLVASVKRETSYLLHQHDLWHEAVWQKGFHDHALRGDDDVVSVCRYIVANPLRKGLVGSVNDYPHWDCRYL